MQVIKRSVEPRSDSRISIPRRDSRRPAVFAIALSVMLVVLTHLWGEALRRRGVRLTLGVPPIFGRADWRPGVGSVPGVVIAVVALAYAPLVAERRTWRSLLVVGTLAAGAWATALALNDGSSALTAPLSSVHDYLHDVPRVGSPLSFLANFVTDVPGYTTHVRGHPPGMILVLWTMDRVGLGGPGWAAFLVVGGGAAVVPATLMALRDVGGERRARRAAPFLAFAPAAIWVATSADALFAGVITWGVALVVVATGRAGRRADALAAAGGLLFGLACFLSYGSPLLAGIPFAVGAHRRRARPLLVAAGAVVVVMVGFAAAGFWWPDGLRATHAEYYRGTGSFRPYGYFVVANIAAFLVVLGPAAVAGLARLRHRAVWLLVGGAVGAVLVADASGLAKGEIERIWLPYVPWLLIATSALPSTRVAQRSWLGAQLAFALLLQTAVRFPW